MFPRFLSFLMLLLVASAQVRSATVYVDIGNGFYSPDKLTVGVGDTVVWDVRHGGHTVTAGDGTFDSSGGTQPPTVLPVGARYTFTFQNVGVYPYSSRTDGPGMKGTITVQEPLLLTVKNTADTGPGSLRQAITDSNNYFGPSLIKFDIPGPGVHTIVPSSLLPTLTHHATIDGYSQPGSAPNTDPLGINAKILIEVDGRQAGHFTGGGIAFISSSLIRGVAVYGFYSAGIELHSDSTVEGCFVGTDATGTNAIPNGSGVQSSGSRNLVGGTTPAARNLISGNTGGGVAVANNDRVEGNFIGTDVTGKHALGNAGGASLGSSFSIIGGTVPGARNVISGNLVGVSLAQGTGNLIVGNYIGVDVTGTQPVPNGESGIFLNHANRNSSTDSSEIRGNVISGNGTGIRGTYSYHMIIQSNNIGTDASGQTPIPNDFAGIYLDTSDTNQIGGETAGAGNVIAFNKGSGIVLSVSGNGNAILGNSIFGNGTYPYDIGIVLGAQGATANDPGDTDAGPNTVQNRPVFRSVTFSGSQATLEGKLNSVANTAYRLEFFATDKALDRGSDGQAFLGSVNVITDASGNAAFTQSFSIPPGPQIITATATDPDGNTSEFGGLPDHALNIATRASVRAGNEVLIGGFIITGNENKRVIVRAIGPSLTAQGVTGALQDPTLELFHENTSIAFNDDWKSEEVETAGTGIAPTANAESALVRTLPPGAYTTVVRGKNDTAGIALVEIYDLESAADCHLANISTRGVVGTGDNVLIGGFIVGGKTGREPRVIVRGIGPSLTNAGIEGALQDPTLALYNLYGDKIAENDNWKETQQSELQASGVAPSNDAEAALAFSTPPGNYTAILQGKGNGTGIGLVEVYDVP